MAKDHGARQQKRIAKQKAKRSAKRSLLQRLTSKDPTTRLQRAESWPVVEALVATTLWKEGIGSLAIARRSRRDVSSLQYSSWMSSVWE